MCHNESGRLYNIGINQWPGHSRQTQASWLMVFKVAAKRCIQTNKQNADEGSQVKKKPTHWISLGYEHQQISTKTRIPYAQQLSLMIAGVADSSWETEKIF